jgi:pyruvate formate lyase activating enzyme
MSAEKYDATPTTPVLSDLSRRVFLERLARYGTAFATVPAAMHALGMISEEACAAMGLPKEVEFYEKLPNRKTKCHTCPTECEREPGKESECRTHNNKNGVLYTYAFNNPCILKTDPIEKLPQYHFMPGTTTLSIATGGCNMRCLYCQNWEQSQSPPEKLKTFPFDGAQAKEMALHKKIPTFAYTYTDPVVFFEYIKDLVKHTRPSGIRHVAASAAFMQEKPLLQLCQNLDSITVTLKGFSEEFYRKICGDRPLKPVLESLVTIKKSGIWLEIVNLVIPSYNDNMKNIKEMCKWIVQNLGSEVPLHFARFSPEYKMKNLPSTPIPTLEKAKEIAQAMGIKFVYLSNVAPHIGNNTYCPSCKNLLIERLAFQILQNRMTQGRCPRCGSKIPGIWDNAKK